MATALRVEEHVPVLLTETINGLQPFPGATFIDATLGGAGHAEQLLHATAPTGRLLGLDNDAAAISRARSRLESFGSRAVLAQANFRDMAAVAAAHGFARVNGAILDLGVSWQQISEPDRGFSFQRNGPLDMRMDPDTPLTASEIVNEWTQEELADVIYRFGEEPGARRIARAIVAARPLHTTGELADVVNRVIGGRGSSAAGRKGRGGHRIHPATRVFQAIRIMVNDELGALEAALPQATGLLVAGGRFAVITYHSLEDRIVKQYIQREVRDCICPPNFPACRCGHKATLKAITRRPIRPSEAEIRANPRSRSAKLRIAERL